MLPRHYRSEELTVRFFGLVSAIGLVGIGLTPYDRYLANHLAALFFWLGPLFLLMLVFLFLASTKGLWVWVLRGLAIAVIYAVIRYAFASNLAESVVMQKVTAVLGIVWFLAIASPVHPVFRRSTGVPGRLFEVQLRRNPMLQLTDYVIEQRARAEVETAPYRQLLEQGHRKPNTPRRPPAS